MIGTLKQYLDCEWVYRSAKYVFFIEDNSIWVGSISSRSGWQTPPAVFGWFEGGNIYFVTTTGSLYMIEEWK